MQRFLQGLCCAAATAFLFLCVGNRVNAATSYSVPENSGFKAYMSYHKITDKNSKQWELQQRAETNEDGIRVVDGRYCVSVGSYFGAPVGTPIDVHLDTGIVLQCITGDGKADKDTDEMNVMIESNGNVVEFIVDTDVLSKDIKRQGTLSADPRFEGKVTSVVVYSDHEPEITEATKSVTEVDTVQVGDVELTRVNYASDNDVNCVYTTTEQAEDITETFLTYTPIDGMVIGN